MAVHTRSNSPSTRADMSNSVQLTYKHQVVITVCTSDSFETEPMWTNKHISAVVQMKPTDLEDMQCSANKPLRVCLSNMCRSDNSSGANKRVVLSSV